MVKPAADPKKWLDEHGDAMYAYCLLRVREPAAAEDLVQEALLAALQSLDSFKGQSSERTWLIGILKHKILDHLRRASREKPLDLGRIPGEDTEEYFDETEHWKVPMSEWDQPERSLENEQFWSTFNNCLERLPDRLRMVYALKEIDGLATEDILETLNISTANNLWVMLSRSRTHLRLCLETNWFTE
jgi:RNA polymerase sigma-70 factor (ECF subfamily)